MTRPKTALCLVLLGGAQAFVPRAPRSKVTTGLFVSELERTQLDEQQDVKVQPPNLASSPSSSLPTLLGPTNIPPALRVEGRGIPSRQERVQLLDSSTYESTLIDSWNSDPSKQTGFDWEIEKWRRYFAGLRMRDDGSWVRQPSILDFLVSPIKGSGLPSGPRPVNVLDTGKVIATNLLASVGLGPALGMAAVPNAVIQKYEGSMLSFIKGVLGGDLQTLAGGPLFLLLAKYFEDYGPIFNLSL